MRNATRAQVDAALRPASRIEVGATEIVRTAVVGDRPLRVVVARARLAVDGETHPRIRLPAAGEIVHGAGASRAPARADARTRVRA